MQTSDPRPFGVEVTSILPWSLLLGCGPDGSESEPDMTDTTRPLQVAPSIVLLEPAERLNRISMALRGIRPSYDDMVAVEADPSKIEPIVDGYLDDQEFGVTMRDLHADTLLNRWEGAQVPALAGTGLEGLGLSEINASMMEEPLQLITHVIMRDRPYTEIMTSDEVMADPIVAALWGLKYTGDPKRGDWAATHWTDGRPAAGVLSSSGLMVAHQSCGINNNRGRANHISRAFLCHDIAYSSVEIDGFVDISQPENVTNALETNDVCISCHQSLDGLGSYFYGYVTILPSFDLVGNPAGPAPGLPITFYKTFNEDDWSTDPDAMDYKGEVPYGTNRPPSYFGQTGSDYDNLADLGQAIASDPRFASCAAQRFYAYFNEVDLDSVSIDTVAPLATEFVDKGYNAKQLAKSIVMSDEFAAAYADDAATADGLVGMKRIRIEQLGRMMEDLTGFRWIVNSDDTNYGYDDATGQVDLPYEFGTVDVTASDRIGFRSMWGGLDSYWVLKPSYTTSPASSLVLRRYAAQAASYVVEHDFAKDAADRKLLGFVDSDTFAEDPIRAQLARLHARILVELVDPQSPEVDRTWSLWKSVYDRTGSPTNAWTVTLAAMLQDVKVMHY
jgi:hypothetical protein